MEKNQGGLSCLFLEDSSDINDLNSQLPVSSAVSVDAFVEECSELIDGVDPRAHTHPQQRSIRLPKTSVSVTPFQLREAWKILNQRENTGLRGGLQASAAGLGKSFILVASYILRARCFQVSHQVQQYWSTNHKTGVKKGPGGMPHLSASAKGAGLRCPSQRPGDIVCYCVPTSKARSFVDSASAPHGVALLQVPMPIIRQWISLFESAMLDNSAYNLCIVHSDVPSRLKRDFGAITAALSQPSGRARSAIPETYIFLSSHGNTKVLETFTNASISVGIMFSDESHFAMRLESRSMAIAKEQAHFGDGLDLWLVSATPFRNLEDWELPIGIMSNSAGLSRTAAVADMIASRDKARASAESRALFHTAFAKVFDRDLVLRNTATSQFGGRPITDLQVVRPNRVWFPTPQEYLPDVQKVAYGARDVIREQALDARLNGEHFSPEYASAIDARLHFVSLFPGAASLIHKGVLEIEEETVRKIIGTIKENKLKVERVARFNQNLEQIVHGSPKLDFICDEIRRMQEDKEKRTPDPKAQNNLHEENLSLKKMVIITPTLGTAVYLYLHLLKRMLSLTPVLLHSQALPEHHEAAVNSFQSITARKNARHSHILIAPFASAGTGLNLQSANYQILCSPLNSRDSEAQAFARTNRTGQRLALHHSVLLTQDSPADLISIVKYAGRVIRNDPFELRRRLVLQELGGFKTIQTLADWGYELMDVQNRNAPRETGLDELPFLDPGEYKVCRIDVPPAVEDTTVELLYFNPDTLYGDTLACTQAWTDFDLRPKHERLPLRDILFSFWVLTLQRPARELRRILYHTVLQDDLNSRLRPFVYRLMGEELTTSLVISDDAMSSQETEAFETLSTGAPFCVGARKMLEEYRELQGLKVHSFEFLPMREPDGNYTNPPYFCFRINVR